MSAPLTTGQAAKALSLTRQQISALCKAGTIKASKITARLYLIPASEVERYRTAEKRKYAPARKNK